MTVISCLHHCVHVTFAFSHLRTCKRLPDMRALLPLTGRCADVADALIKPTVK